MTATRALIVIAILAFAGVAAAFGIVRLFLAGFRSGEEYGHR